MAKLLSKIQKREATGKAHIQEGISQMRIVYLLCFFLVSISCKSPEWPNGSTSSAPSISDSSVSGCEPMEHALQISLKNSKKNSFFVAKEGRKSSLLKQGLHFIHFHKELVSPLVLQKAYASPPPNPGFCDGLGLQQKPPITLTWEPGAKPKIIGWQGAFSCMEAPSTAVKSLSVQRSWWGDKNKPPNKLIIVPNNNKLKPKILEIKENQQKVHFSTEKISANKIWLWGRLPKSPCTGVPCGGPLAHSLSLSFMNGQHLADIRGVFLVPLTKKPYPPQYILEPHPEAYGTVQGWTIDEFQAMPAVLLSVCKKTTHCKNNDKSLGPGQNSWGQSLELKVTFKKAKNPSACPI